jgi:hypothetical protein
MKIVLQDNPDSGLDPTPVVISSTMPMYEFAHILEEAANNFPESSTQWITLTFIVECIPKDQR